MIRVLVISGSPVRESSVEILLNEVVAGMREQLREIEDLHADFVQLNELKYIPCQACGKAPTPAFCFFDDDMTSLYPKVANCDALVIGTPVYFDGVSGQAKMFIDRCNCFRPYDFNSIEPEHDFIKLLKQKRPGGMVIVGGDEAGIEGARRTIAGFFKWVEVTNEGVVKHSSTDDRRSGTAADDPAALGSARELGKRIAARIGAHHD
jgi:multimeric flavodoxin WrbA